MEMYRPDPYFLKNRKKSLYERVFDSPNQRASFSDMETVLDLRFSYHLSSGIKMGI